MAMFCNAFKWLYIIQVTEYKINVTGLAKRGLPHTSNLPLLTNHNFKLVKAIDLKVD